MTGTTAHHRADLAHMSAVRVTGTLAEDAQLTFSTQAEPHAVLRMVLEPAQGLPYEVRHDLGPDVAEHMAMEQQLPAFRRGHLVSVCARYLQVRRDHGREVLRVYDCTHFISHNPTHQEG